MSRKGSSPIRPRQPDLHTQSETVTRLIGYVLKDGRKSVAEKQVYDAVDLLAKEFGQDQAIPTLEKAIETIKPKVEVRPRRIGGAVYQVPTPVRSHRQTSLAIRWFVRAARQLSNKQYHSFAQKLVAEIKLILKSEGTSYNKRLEVERMAEANKAFSHLRW